MRDRTVLADVRTFPQLIGYLRDELDWPTADSDFEDLTFDYTPEELGIDSRNAAKIQEIKRLRPLSTRQPWGIFFVKFEPRRLPVVALRRILNAVVVKKRSSSMHAERAAWATEDLLFISDYGEGDQRQISFAHFAQGGEESPLPSLNVLGWDNLDTSLHMTYVAETLALNLKWPSDDVSVSAWRDSWRSAFTIRHLEAITTSRALALRLATLARALRDRISAVLTIETPDGPVSKLLNAFQSALIHDLTPDEFADMYAQTIAYGLLTGRIANRDAKNDDFVSQLPLTNPLLKELMEAFLRPGGSTETDVTFDELGIAEVIHTLEAANLDAVLRDFGDRNPDEDPVISFYELFLTAYDPKKRMQLGVFYTPRPVVSHIVRTVHELLRAKFGLALGLADTSTWRDVLSRQPDIELPEGVHPDEPFVQIIDFATGTGTFLIEAVDVIHSEVVGAWRREGRDDHEIADLWNEYVPDHLLPRLCGYEILMAPYAIAHLKMGLKLGETGYRFERPARVEIYLTNALESPQDLSAGLQLAVPALAHEAKAVNQIKRRKRFTAVIGNPPYSLHSQNLTTEARSIVAPYKHVDGHQIKEKGALQFEKILQDDYVKFFRLAQMTLDSAGAGVLGIITNHGYLENPTLRGMRASLLETFATFWAIDLHGNSLRGERPPGGGPDDNVFDIQQGVAIAIAARHPSEGGSDVRRGDVWGTRKEKYTKLAATSARVLDLELIHPSPPFYFLAIKEDEHLAEYMRGWRFDQMFQQGSMGVVTARDKVSIVFEGETLERMATDFRDSPLADEQICNRLGIPLKKGWDIGRARSLLREEVDLKQFITDIQYRPFDWRRIFYHRALVWGMSWPTMQHMVAGDNVAISVTRGATEARSGHSTFSAMVGTGLIGHHLSGIGPVSYYFPLRLTSGSASLLRDQWYNFTDAFLATVDAKWQSPERYDVFAYLYAMLYSSSYRQRYAEQLRVDLPRIPLIQDPRAFTSLAALGRELIDQHTLKATRSTALTPEYRGPRDPVVLQVAWSNGTVSIGSPDLRPSGSAKFVGVSSEAWQFRIGGFQVCEKWLKDRIGRTLSEEDIAHYKGIVGALSHTVGIQERIETVIQSHGGWPMAFHRGEAEDVRLGQVGPDGHLRHGSQAAG